MIVINEEVSRRIHSLRFLQIVFVVIIHNGINEKTFVGRGLAVEIPPYVEKVQDFIGAITGVAVPLFFLISGFLLYAKEDHFLGMLRKRSRTILVPYLLWTGLFVLLYFVMQTLPYTRGFFTTDPAHLIRNYGIRDWIDVFWGKLTYRNDGGHPFVYQFWFIRDLFILDLLFIPIKRLIDRFPLGSFALFLILWIGGVEIYLVSPAALFFFALGCYVVKSGLDERAIDSLGLPDLALTYLLTILAGLFVPLPLLGNLTILLGILFFLRLAGLAVRNPGLYRLLVWLEQYEFIVYAVHAVIIPQLLKIIIRALPLRGGFLLLEYLGVVVVSIALCIVFGVVFKRLCPRVYALFTGGR
jgi:surface polysaccharide O-acyltransferase-like enzyme